jgi:hypothetical protein
VPCEDGYVWVKDEGINTRNQIVKQKNATKKDWVAVFLQYSEGTVTQEGLYLIPAGDLGKVTGGDFDAKSYPERKMISSWHDNKSEDATNPEVVAQKPQYHGLNDCTHFVTQSLAAGGIHVETLLAPVLFDRLRGLADTKTLAKTVAASDAQAIIDSGLMKVGDVIVYTEGTHHHHGVVYMGNGTVAMHTFANHPDHPKLHGEWTLGDASQLVTLIHFGRDDAAILANSPLLGWWSVLRGGVPEFYYFDKAGHVGSTKRSPLKLNQPLYTPDRRGYWFLEATKLRICWTDTGALEVFTVKVPVPDTHMEGTGSSSEALVADKKT